MIRLLVVGAARTLFNLAVVALALALLLLYGSYRLLRSTVAKGPGRPVREAGFGVLLALVVLAKAVAASRPAGVTQQDADRLVQTAEKAVREWQAPPVDDGAAFPPFT